MVSRFEREIAKQPIGISIKVDTVFVEKPWLLIDIMQYFSLYGLTLYVMNLLGVISVVFQFSRPLFSYNRLVHILQALQFDI